MITSIILSYAWWFIIPLLIAGAVASYIYVPVIGKVMAICLCSAAAALSAYELGYADRGKLDKSVQLQAQLDIANENLKQAQIDALATKKILDEATDREQDAQQTADDLKTKVEDYEKQLIAVETRPDPVIVVPDKTGKCPTVRKVSTCLLTDADVTGLQSIGVDPAGRKTRPTKRP